MLNHHETTPPTKKRSDSRLVIAGQRQAIHCADWHLRHASKGPRLLSTALETRDGKQGYQYRSRILACRGCNRHYSKGVVPHRLVAPNPGNAQALRRRNRSGKSTVYSEIRALYESCPAFPSSAIQPRCRHHQFEEPE